jgi:hypothetical protein
MRQRQLVLFWDTLMTRLLGSGEQEPEVPDKEFFDLVEEARLEWQAAVSRFNHVTDPDLIDHAIHNMQAAERKYTFLLKKARQEGYRLPARLDALRERRSRGADI